MPATLGVAQTSRHDIGKICLLALAARVISHLFDAYNRGHAITLTGRPAKLLGAFHSSRDEAHAATSEDGSAFRLS
jgi:hypothetical protein